MAAYVEHCALLEPGRCSGELQARKQRRGLGSWDREEQEGRLLIPPPLNTLSS